MAKDADSNPGGSEIEPAVSSVHTEGFASVLAELKCSLVVSTYQAGKLVLVRNMGDSLNTHFCAFRKPMGLAYKQDCLAIGTPLEIWFYRDVLAGSGLDPFGHDAVFLPRSAHVTGEILVHEMAFGGDELWIVNTRFSCLCTLDNRHNFVPRWRPQFISVLAAEDRCHLNGLAMHEGNPRWVTVMGLSDAPQGWRGNKVSGGAVIDIKTNAVIADQLSMPHSPRWHNGALYFLNSGLGTLDRIHVDTGKIETVASLPGFTRGLDMIGDYAFVGLSKVRETAIFGGTEAADNPERICGVCAIDVRSGSAKGLLQFDRGVEEIFAIQILPGLRLPNLVNEDLGIISDTFVLPP